MIKIKNLLIIEGIIENCSQCPLSVESNNPEDSKPICLITKQTLYYSHRNSKVHHNCPLVSKSILVRWEGPFNEAKDDAEVYCGHCDFCLEYGIESWEYCPMCGNKIIWHKED